MTNNLNHLTGETSKKALYIPIPEKILLSIHEAAEYSNIGINKIHAMLNTPNCPFVLFGE